MGSPAGPSPPCRPSRGDEGGEGGRGRLHPGRHRGPHPLRLLHGELAAAAAEISALMALLEVYARKEKAELRKQGVRVRVLGELDRLAPETRRAIDGIMEATSAGRNLRLNLMISYSGRGEILRAVRALATKRRRGGGSLRRSTGGLRRGPVHVRDTRPGPPHPDLRGAPHQQLHALAAGVHRDPHHPGAVARLHAAGPLRRRSRLSEAGTPIRTSDDLLSDDFLGDRTDPDAGRTTGAAACGGGSGHTPCLVLLYVGGWLLTAVIAVVALLATRELFALGEVQGIRPFPAWAWRGP
jgi:hypothetical protein